MTRETTSYNGYGLRTGLFWVPAWLLFSRVPRAPHPRAVTAPWIRRPSPISPLAPTSPCCAERRENWGVPGIAKNEAIYGCLMTLHDPNASERAKESARRTLALFDANDIAAGKLRIAESKLAPPPLLVDARTALTTPYEQLTPDLWPLRSLLDACRDDPARFQAEVLGRKLWSKQIEVCHAIARSPITVVPAGRAVGKSYLMQGSSSGGCTPGRTRLVITTGPDHRQVVSVLWKEMRRALLKPRMRLGWRPSQQRLFVTPAAATQRRQRLGSTRLCRGRSRKGSAVNTPPIC